MREGNNAKNGPTQLFSFFAHDKKHCIKSLFHDIPFPFENKGF